MRIREIEISGYRSLKEVRMELGGVTILVGPNGCGKSNIYQSIQLLASAAHGQFARRIAEEGGIRSVLWAGERSKDEEYRARLAVVFDELSYELEFGRMPHSQRMKDDPNDPNERGLNFFKDDPDIKIETLSLLSGKKNIPLFNRKGSAILAKNLEGRTVQYPVKLMNSESVLSELREPEKFPELSMLRSLFAQWRFYHDFRTDIYSPVRQHHLATLTPILSHDASDLAAAIATIRSIGDRQRFDHFVDRGFPGSEITVDEEEGELYFEMSFPGLNRSLEARELSDGTLQYLCLLAALLTPRPASFMVFNEPETSIHPDLHGPLAELILAAAKDSQILLTTHSRELSDYIKKRGRAQIFELEKVDGATRIRGVQLSKKVEEDDDESAAIRAFRQGRVQQTQSEEDIED